MPLRRRGTAHGERLERPRGRLAISGGGARGAAAADAGASLEASDLRCGGSGNREPQREGGGPEVFRILPIRGLGTAVIEQVESGQYRAAIGVPRVRPEDRRSAELCAERLGP